MRNQNHQRTYQKIQNEDNGCINLFMQFFKIIFRRVRAKCMSLTIQWRQFYK